MVLAGLACFWYSRAEVLTSDKVIFESFLCRLRFQSTTKLRYGLEVPSPRVIFWELLLFLIDIRRCEFFRWTVLACAEFDLQQILQIPAQHVCLIYVLLSTSFP